MVLNPPHHGWPKAHRFPAVYELISTPAMYLFLAAVARQSAGLLFTPGRFQTTWPITERSPCPASPFSLKAIVLLVPSSTLLIRLKTEGYFGLGPLMTALVPFIFITVSTSVPVQPT